ncbi:sulfite reductase subunit alpha [Roseomonas sp. PWR1]|uniref:Sulfite reductase subunit alpha n=1 Tax=Roseomonas nitratireducens TaxID=2820810 RepID=A0ABS4ANC7_9PROT|nr:sulfite reductase subunit alpha [Neoroseomonas nitratireducens]MBP0462719.1 sulfite reductase subunit alpha [Neoroseomonas nitratireducens]
MNAILPPGLPAAPVPLIPDSAPFTPAQRAWLNGFLAGLYGGAAAVAANASPGAAPAPAEEFPWHDPALELEDRLKLAEGRPLNRRLMAAMAQLDCGQCGYLCQTYAEALASGAETSAALCVPGAKATQKALKALLAEAPAAVPKPAAAPVPAAAAGRPVRVVAAHRLTGECSAKDVRHVVIDLADSGLAYEPGDSLSVAAPNDPALVEAVLAALGAADDAALREELLHRRDIARPLDRTLDLLAGAARHAPHAAALRALADGDDGAEPADADLLDLLAAFPSARPPVADLIASLPVLKPRLYSIASSPLACPGRVELCVGVVRADRRGRLRDGVASCHLAFRADAATPLQAHVQTSHFRLPADAATPVIMVGPGTGIAPFRAFLQHREAIGAKGRAWLFFGDQRSATDFLFGEEIAAWKAKGVLTQLSLAWSRDGRDKVYVQHRMTEAATDLWRWLQDGAHVYVCGDASRMAKDVDAALRGIARSEGGMNADQARDWIVALARQGRYQRDVY